MRGAVSYSELPVTRTGLKIRQRAYRYSLVLALFAQIR